MPVNYQLGKIYKIDQITEFRYMWDLLHYLDYALDYLSTEVVIILGKSNGTYGYTTSYDLFDEYGPENCQIILSETCPCNNIDELKLKERFYIESLIILVPSRTIKILNYQTACI